MVTTSWVLERDLTGGTANGRMRLFCLPHAGSGSAGFYRWRRQLRDANVCPVHLLGRDARYREPAIADGDVLLSALHGGMRAHLSEPYAIFGHSMGALLAFAWAQRIQTDGLPLPAAVILSARAPRAAAHTPLEQDDDALLHSLDRRFGGGLVAALQDPEMRAAFLPTLRADLRVVQTTTLSPEPLRVPIFAAHGEADPSVSAEAMLHWRDYAAAGFTAATFPGGHFYHFAEGEAAMLPWLQRVLVPAT